jgi:hypothetical protein
MARKPRTPKVDTLKKQNLIDVLFGKGETIQEIGEKCLQPDWLKELEKYFDKPVITPEPTKTPKNIKYKAMYEKLAKNIENMNAVVLKNKAEIGEE